MADTAEQNERPRAGHPDAERYREAAEAALDQLDWCVGYLHRIRKPELAEALAQNRSEIRRRLR
jgi:hypothetical protein